jgi:hypothetical protein
VKTYRLTLTIKKEGYPFGEREKLLRGQVRKQGLIIPHKKQKVQVKGSPDFGVLLVLRQIDRTIYPCTNSTSFTIIDLMASRSAVLM